MDTEKAVTVIAAANSYNKKYYFNQEFERLPKAVKDDIKRMCIGFVEEMGGSLSLEMNNDELVFKTGALDRDAYYDEIGSGLKIKQLSKQNNELLLQVQAYVKCKKEMNI